MMFLLHLYELSYYFHHVDFFICLLEACSVLLGRHSNQLFKNLDVVIRIIVPHFLTDRFDLHIGLF